MIRIFVSLSLCGALLAGCAHPSRVSDTLTLKEGEGVIVYRMNCGPQVAYGEFFRSGKSSAGYFAGFSRAGALLCQEGVQTQRIAAGNYYIGKIGYTGWIDIEEKSAASFTVIPGKLNYIGHIELPSIVTRDAGKTTVGIGDPVVNDKSAEAQDWLTTKQAPLLRYEFVKTLAQVSAAAS